MKQTIMEHSPLEEVMVGRERSIFADDLSRFGPALADAIEGRRFLFIGGAGSIGSKTLETVLSYKPSAVHVVDHNENGLAELVRSLHSSPAGLSVVEFLAMPLDYGSQVFAHWLKSLSHPYDYVLNFAALKHVRSEKDPYSVLGMLDNNVNKLVRLAGLLPDKALPQRVFSVSTDKAANPSSMMGATKRIMEHALFGRAGGLSGKVEVTSARFANVAMSNGSLLQAWQLRFDARQPLACPVACKRYFVSLRESGHLCTLAAILGTRDHIQVPALNPDSHLVLLDSLVTKFLEFHGHSPVFLESPEEAKEQLSHLVSEMKYPVLLTPLNTAGEKPYEEFVGAGESLAPSTFEALRAIRYLQPVDDDAFREFLGWLDGALNRPTGPLRMDSIVKAISSVEPGFAAGHRSAAASLDERM